MMRRHLKQNLSNYDWLRVVSLFYGPFCVNLNCSIMLRSDPLCSRGKPDLCAICPRILGMRIFVFNSNYFTKFFKNLCNLHLNQRNGCNNDDGRTEVRIKLYLTGVTGCTENVGSLVLIIHFRF